MNLIPDNRLEHPFFSKGKPKSVGRILTLLVLGLMIGIASCARKSEPAAPRIVVLGLDGLDWEILQDGISKGRLPAFQQIIKNGAHGVLQSYRPMISPLIWTTLATGRTPEDHNVLSFSVRNNNGQVLVVPSSQRRCAAIWNLLSRLDLSTTVIGWYATWPSESIHGRVVSDRFVQALHTADAGTLTTSLPHVTFPDELADSLYAFRKEYSDIHCAELSRLIHLSDEECQQMENTPLDLNDPVQHLRLILARTDTYHDVLMDLLTNHPTRLTMALFDATDSVAHLFMPYRAPRQDHIPLPLFVKYQDAVDSIYEQMNRLVREVLDTLRQEDILLVISDHGFLSGKRRPIHSAATTEGNAVLWHRLEGTIIAYGSPIRPARIETATVYDITPTLLAWLGLAQSHEMPGRPIPELFDKGTLALLSPPVDDLDEDYAPPPLPEETGDSAPDIKRLQALGYVTGSSGNDATSGADARNVEEHLNLAIFYQDHNRLQEAFTEIEAARRLAPGDQKVEGHYGAILLELNRYPEALAIFEVLKERLLAQRQNTPSDSTPLSSSDLDHSLSEVWNYLGDTHFHLRDLSQAIECYRQSLQYEPNQIPTLYNYGLTLGMTGEYGESEATLLHLLSIQPDHFKARYSLAVAQIRLQKVTEARSRLLALLEEEKNNPNLYYLVGQTYRVENDADSARTWYQKSLDVDAGFAKAQNALRELSSSPDAGASP